MPKYSLKKKDAAFLTLEIDGAEYNIPLVSSMKRADCSSWHLPT